jgi:hypothetical protein
MFCLPPQSFETAFYGSSTSLPVIELPRVKRLPVSVRRIVLESKGATATARSITAEHVEHLPSAATGQ